VTQYLQCNEKFTGSPKLCSPVMPIALCARLDAVAVQIMPTANFEQSVDRPSCGSPLPRPVAGGAGGQGCRRSAGVRDRCLVKGVCCAERCAGDCVAPRAARNCEQKTAVLRSISRRRDDATMALQRQAGWYRKRRMLERPTCRKELGNAESLGALQQLGEG